MLIELIDWFLLKVHIELFISRTVSKLVGLIFALPGFNVHFKVDFANGNRDD